MKTTLSRAAKASALSAALVLTGIAIPGVAYADTTKCSYIGYDRACATNYTSGSTKSVLEICDNTNDGKSVQAAYLMEGSGTSTNTIDPYGGGCTVLRNSSWRVHWFKIRKTYDTWQPTVNMY
ncbi:hypothetical protein MRQ36_05225 [Micromonospora sp. R77]|uniref:hypothetical protein n=1 Tax=Micromonospora sp. R77 TaxID=2925836 RepID=UPI001F6073D6|nr:hypothetical protein [Micromonospora sp. R77]MCI4061998.1 hypothetical protein [Micromonospora sp. R77]